MTTQQISDPNFMATEDAFEIIFNLAKSQVTSEKEKLALGTVEDFLVNNVWD